MSEFRFGHFEVDSPFGNAGGVVKHVEDVEVMARTGVGWIEAGSYTIEPRQGNALNPETGIHDRIVYYHNPETGETFNSLGMPNRGFDVVETEIPEMVNIADKAGKPLLVNVAPVSTDPVAESRELVTRAYEAGADGVILNAGCPNLITDDGGRHELLSRDPEALHLVLAGLTDVVSKFQMIFVRVSPQLSFEDSRNVLHAIQKSKTVSAIFTPNTWPGHKPLDGSGNPILEIPGNTGGLSGPATAAQAAEQTDWYVTGSRLDIVSSGGIMNGKELKERMYVAYGKRVRRYAAAGAGTTFFYESGDWKHDVDKLIWEYIDGFTSRGPL